LHCPGRHYLIATGSKLEVNKVLNKLNNAHTTIFERPVVKAKDSEPVVPDPAMKGKVIVRQLNDIPTDIKILKRHCRVIIRNLSFHATEENILSKLSAVYGPVKEVIIPKVTIQKHKRQRGDDKDDNTTSVIKSRGFAFATFLCLSDADRAVKDSGNLKICNREVAMDFCMSKEAFSKQATPEELEAIGETTAEPYEEDDEEKAEDIEEEEDTTEDEDMDDDEVESEELNEGDDDEPAEAEVPHDVDEGCTVFVRLVHPLI
jgi:hypothetical protein